MQARRPSPRRPERRPRSAWCGAVLAGLASTCALLLTPATAEAVVVERIVAVVGDDAIFLSELRGRGSPFLRQIVKQVPGGPERAAAESKMYKELLERMVEELLETQAAERAKVTVSSEEIDAAFKNIAGSQGMTVAQLYDMTFKRSGLTEAAYRDEIRRQLLEGKMLSQRVRGRIRITEEDLKNAYSRFQREERERREYRPAWVVLRIMPESSEQAIAERFALAKNIAVQARAGVDFAELAAQFSDDTQTREQGGDLGIRAPQKSPAAQQGKRPYLAKELEAVVMPLEVGEVSEPVRVGDAIAVLKLVARQPSRFESYEAAKPELTQRVQNEILAREKSAWLEDLKRRTHVDVRL